MLESRMNKAFWGFFDLIAEERVWNKNVNFQYHFIKSFISQKNLILNLSKSSSF